MQRVLLACSHNSSVLSSVQPYNCDCVPIQLAGEQQGTKPAEERQPGLQHAMPDSRPASGQINSHLHTHHPEEHLSSHPHPYGHGKGEKAKGVLQTIFSPVYAIVGAKHHAEGEAHEQPAGASIQQV